MLVVPTHRQLAMERQGLLEGRHRGGSCCQKRLVRPKEASNIMVLRVLIRAELHVSSASPVPRMLSAPSVLPLNNHRL